MIINYIMCATELHVHPRNSLNLLSQQLQHLESHAIFAKISSLKGPRRAPTN